MTTSYLEVRTCETCSTFEHALWGFNTHVSVDNSSHLISEFNTETQIRHTYNSKVYKYIDEQINECQYKIDK